MNERALRVLLLLGRLAIAGLFVWAALPKLADAGEFAAAIQNYRVLPEPLVPLFALLVPSAELVVAAGLLVPKLERGALLLSALMLAVFALAMAQARARGIDLRCGCFGAALEAKVSWWTVARSALLCAFSCVLFVVSSRKRASGDGAAADPPVVSG